MPQAENGSTATELAEFPRCIPDMVHLLVLDHGTATADDFIARMLATVAGTAVAALGKERACEMVAAQLVVTEQL